MFFSCEDFNYVFTLDDLMETKSLYLKSGYKLDVWSNKFWMIDLFYHFKSWDFRQENSAGFEDFLRVQEDKKSRGYLIF